MRLTNRLTTGLLLTAVIATTPAGGQDLPVPAQWSTHFAWFLVANRDYRPVSPAADSAITHDHIQYQLRLQAEGLAIVSGGFAPSPDDPVIGLTILRATNLAEARRVAEDDPAVRSGRLIARVREWWVPTDRLP
jgi:uncharacterized protein YciI